LVGQSSPGFPGFVGLTGGDHEDDRPVVADPVSDYFGVPRTDVRIGDYRISMGGGDVPRDVSDLGEETGRNPNGSPKLRLIYQVTSPAPARTLATRASMNRRSESRFR
jgi:hypothetical protein